MRRSYEPGSGSLRKINLRPFAEVEADAQLGADTGMRRKVNQLLGAICILATALTACSADDGRPPPPDGVARVLESETTTPVQPQPTCADGSVQACTIRLKSHAGVTQCFDGMSVCEDGRWGECLEIEELELELELIEERRALSGKR
jgi:hypothetical protein